MLTKLWGEIKHCFWVYNLKKIFLATFVVCLNTSFSIYTKKVHCELNLCAFNFILRADLILLSLPQGDLKQYLKISKSKDEKVKVHPLSTKQKVKLVT